MSILKQVLAEAFASFFRKSPEVQTRRRAGNLPAIGEKANPARHPEHIRTSRSGMKVVILNWNRGENDPFTVVTATIRQYLRACGKNVEVIEITDKDWPAQLGELASAGVEFALTWQGLGSSARVREPDQSLWDHLKIPLICIHGDHPSHMPLNHELESPYCFHLYNNADSARYSNRHFRRSRGASVIDIPRLHHEPLLRSRAGDYFVIAKNIDDPLMTEKSWKERLPKPLFNAFMMAAEALKARIACEAYVEIHDGLDDLISQNNLDWLTPEVNAVGYHDYHSQLDHYLHSHKVVAAVAAMHSFPARIYGRGWDRIARNAPACHIFEAGRSMTNSQDFYYSRFGIIDVSPSKVLHDRTRRAMANEGAFLSSANLEDRFPDIARFHRLFFSFRLGELPEKCAAVVRDPEAHLALSQDFGRAYHDKFPFRDFVQYVDALAKIATSS